MFTHSWALFLLGLLPLLSLLAWFAARRRRLDLARFGHFPVMRGRLTRSRPGRWRAAAETAALFLVILGIAGPQWGRDGDQVAAPGRDLVAVLDVSRSMLAQDVLPNRLDRAKQALVDLSFSLQERGGHRLGLVAFAGQAKIVCPLTHDFDHFRIALAELEALLPPRDLALPAEGSVSGTRLGAALLQAVQAHDSRYRGYQEILLLSDGDDPARDDEWRTGAAAASEHGIPVHTVGIGSPDADSRIPVDEGTYLRHQGEYVLTRLREQPLEQLARSTQGNYIAARTQALPLGDVFRERLEDRAERDGELALPVLRQRYAWAFALALLLFAVDMAAGRWPSRMRRDPA
jgi:Ca-activated chloride channel family protein